MAQKRSRGKGRRDEKHVRLYKHEWECPAYQSLKSDSKVLLFEMRSLYEGQENRIHMSVREVMRRLGVGQRRAESALAELINTGFLRLIQRGEFRRKIRHASVYALENVPIEDKDGAVAPKSYMSWRPPEEKNTVVNSATVGS